MAPKPQRKWKMIIQCHSSAMQCHLLGVLSATSGGGLIRPPGGTPGTRHLFVHGRRGLARTGFDIRRGVESDGIAMTYKLSVPDMYLLESRTASLQEAFVEPDDG